MWRDSREVLRKCCFGCALPLQPSLVTLLLSWCSPAWPALSYLLRPGANLHPSTQGQASPALTGTPCRPHTQGQASPCTDQHPRTQGHVSPALIGTPCRPHTQGQASPALTSTPCRPHTQGQASPALTGTPCRPHTQGQASPALTSTPCRPPTQGQASSALTGTPCRPHTQARPHLHCRPNLLWILDPVPSLSPTSGPSLLPPLFPRAASPASPQVDALCPQLAPCRPPRPKGPLQPAGGHSAPPLILLPSPPLPPGPPPPHTQVDALRPGLLGPSKESFAARYCDRRLVPTTPRDKERKRYDNSGGAGMCVCQQHE